MPEDTRQALADIYGQLTKIPNNPVMGKAINEVFLLDGQNWYQTFPYVFSIQNLTKLKDQYNYALPIPPENISTQMIASCDAVPTLGGVVEEPSANVFWSIQLSGTTGIGIGRDTGLFGDLESTDDEGSTTDSVAKTFRDVIPKTGILSSVLNSIANGAQYVNGAIDAVMGGDQVGGTGPTRSLEYLIQPKQPYFESAVSKQTNGYTEIHKLHKFFLLYTHLNSRKDTEKNTLGEVNSDDLKSLKEKRYGLYFINYKDNQKFRIVLKNFVITKSANSPFLYRYQIQLKGWNIREAGTNKSLAVNRFGKGGDLESVITLTATSAITKAKNVARAFSSAKTDPLGTFLSIPPVI